MAVTRDKIRKAFGAVRVLGLAGSNGGTLRFVGAVASGTGAPTTGIFAVGDVVYDPAGAWYGCTVAGSPGTWVALSGGSANLAGAQTFTGLKSFSAGLLSTSATQGLGYGTGAGGTVTQGTNAATGVTLNKPTGQITTVALTTAAGAEEQFTVTNSTVAATDVVSVTTTYAGAGTPLVTTTKTAAGAFDVLITNLHASAALNAAMVINFVVLKGVAA